MTLRNVVFDLTVFAVCALNRPSIYITKNQKSLPNYNVRKGLLSMSCRIFFEKKLQVQTNGKSENVFLTNREAHSTDITTSSVTRTFSFDIFEVVCITRSSSFH